MPSNLEQIVSELVRLDPTLAEKVSELRALIARLLEQKTTITPNEQFISSLHQKLMESHMPEQHSTSFRWMPLLAIPALAAIALVTYPYLAPKEKQATDSGVAITAGRQNAFGTLNAELVTNRSSVVPATSKDMQVVTSAGSTEVAPDTGTVSDYRLPVYTYDASFSIPSQQVMKRTKSIAGLPGASASAVTIMNLASFSGLRTDLVTWSQRTTDGYTITVDAREGVISIARDASYYTTILNTAATGTATRDSIATNGANTAVAMPSDEAKSVAANFLRSHGISTVGYGEPVVMNQVSGYGAAYLEKSIAPSMYDATITVTYPWVINGLTVFDESGNEFGLQVTIDGRTKTVASVYNLMSRTFTSSSYDISNDPEAIRAFLARGGWMWSAAPDSDTKTTSYELGAPTSVYMISRYQLNGGQDDLLVPALKFNVSAADQKTVGRAAVIVPVIKDLLQPSSASSSGAAPSAAVDAPAVKTIE